MTYTDGTGCPDCGGALETTDGQEYDCPDCDRTYDVADLFYP